MKKSITGNTSLFKKAEDKAKELIKNYITKMGALAGKDYTINWK